ncbi:AraC family transcriptional regulator [Paenibacillus thailandensis]|uniref:AraC family transcriptional regulator n=1 Tax=Paenibacillus thailandensis TaxID=393250 RepID=A0ABW5R2N8_9BACL
MALFNDVIVRSPGVGQEDLSLLFYGKENCDPGHSWGPGLRDSYLLHYVESGRGLFRIGDETFHLTAGQGFLIVPGTLVYYKADDADPWTYAWVGFKGLQAKSLLRRSSLGAEHPVFRTANAGWFGRFHDLLSGPQASSPTRDVRGQSLLYGLIADLIDDNPASAQEGGASVPKQRYIEQAVEYIETNYSQKISVLDIARFVGLDRTYLSGLFKERFGVPLQLYLLQFRMNRAVELLALEELSVSDVSRSVGYADPFLFSKMFKRTIGSSPRDFRKSTVRQNRS